MKFSQFLEKKFLEWQSLVGERKTVREFASYIGVSQATISTWWNTERVPEGENVMKLATKLGVEVFDVLGLPRPDGDLLFIQTVWGELDENTRTSNCATKPRWRSFLKHLPPHCKPCNWLQIQKTHLLPSRMPSKNKKPSAAKYRTATK